MAEPDLQEFSDQAPLHRNLGLRLDRTERGVICRARVGTEFLVDGSQGTVHGGIIATLLDIAATFALIATSGHDWVTVDLRVDYLRPVRAGAVTVEGDVLRAGRRVGSARSTLRDAEGTECAVAIGTFASAGERSTPPGEPSGS
ncbi:MAG TPA: PaaI family thioesterase [Chloroflexota bacterium]